MNCHIIDNAQEKPCQRTAAWHLKKSRQKETFSCTRHLDNAVRVLRLNTGNVHRFTSACTDGTCTP